MVMFSNTLLGAVTWSSLKDIDSIDKKVEELNSKWAEISTRLYQATEATTPETNSDGRIMRSQVRILPPRQKRKIKMTTLTQYQQQQLINHTD